MSFKGVIRDAAVSTAFWIRGAAGALCKGRPVYCQSFCTRNWGDAVNSFLLEAVTGRRVRVVDHTAPFKKRDTVEGEDYDALAAA